VNRVLSDVYMDKLDDLESAVRALVMISVIPNVPTPTISEQVEKLHGMEKIYEVTGDYDIMSVFSSPTIEGINQSIEEIRKIGGNQDEHGHCPPHHLEKTLLRKT